MSSRSEETEFDERIEALLRAAEHGNPLLPAFEELFDRYRAQQRLLDRLTRISDHFQQAERDRGLNYVDRYQRKVRQIEKIVRISDRYQSMLRELNDRLHLISTRDELTGLPNRRYLLERLDTEISQVARNGGTFSVGLADIDHFKAVNDTRGHAAGDAVLAHTARCIQESIRDYDVCARWGGEEFLILFPQCGVADALKLAERVRHVVEDQTRALGLSPVITLSIGITEFRPSETVDAMLRRADEALYRAKESGRNCTVSADQADLPRAP